MADDELVQLAKMDEQRRTSVMWRLTAAQRRELEARWLGGWAQAGQLPRHDDWRVWVIMAGRGFGKTRAGAEWVSEVARTTPDARIALVGGTADDVRQVMIEGRSGLVAVAKTNEHPRWRRGTGEIEFPSGARAYVYSADAPERLRGPEHHAAWCDEIGKWRNGMAAWNNMMMGLRLGNRPRVVVTTTPRPTPLMHRVLALSGMTKSGGASGDNLYLPAAFVEALAADYAGTRLARQEIEGQLIDDAEGALWTEATLARCRTAQVPALVRTVVGVDPPAGSERGAGDACGIVAVGIDAERHAYVIEDASVAATSPEAWAQAVAACARRAGTAQVIAERNQGGTMVRSVLNAADAGLQVTLVHASEGKAARAEPVALLYQRGRVWHAGAFDALEAELRGLTPRGYEGPGRSPDRADALVWAVTALLGGRRGRAAVRRLA